MAYAIQRRRGTSTEHNSFTGLVGEITIDTTNNTIRVHDGSTAGGHRLAKYSEINTQENIEDVVGSLLTAGSGISLSYDDSAGTLTITNTTSAGDIESVAAGDGLSGGGTSGAVSLALDLNELTAAAVDVANDSIAIIDAGDNSSKKESIASRMLAILIVFQRRQSLPAEFWQFWSFFREGNHRQPNVGNFDRFFEEGIIASRMLEILVVFQRRKSLAAECWNF